ncbi:MAG TPA: TIGR01777 family oxidoreductase [Candidatus Limnocylindrales bacterium]|nr:TIGR01777 family oxidoreductase [Candidatus Limnocylindrales bacterium]
MKIVITGATGMIGSVLIDRLSTRLDTSLILLSRNPGREIHVANKQWLLWQPGSDGEWERSIDGADAVINLAGEPIAGKRWSAQQKLILRSSRIDSTRSLVEAIGKAKIRPKTLISASAVGYYGPHGDERLDETSKPGEDFLSRLCVDWENEAKKAEAFDVRVCLLRTGVVLAKGAGALRKMVPPFKLFAGGPLGSGQQWMPWIHINDEVSLIEFLLDRADAHGAFNGTAPNPVTMEEFSRTLGGVLDRPSWMSVPPSILALMIGEMADMLLTGQRAAPEAALKMGFQFKYSHLADALSALRL